MTDRRVPRKAPRTLDEARKLFSAVSVWEILGWARFRIDTEAPPNEPPLRGGVAAGRTLASQQALPSRLFQGLPRCICLHSPENRCDNPAQLNILSLFLLWFSMKIVLVKWIFHKFQPLTCFKSISLDHSYINSRSVYLLSMLCLYNIKKISFYNHCKYLGLTVCFQNVETPLNLATMETPLVTWWD